MAASPGHGGISEPLTAEQQHQVSSHKTSLLSFMFLCLQRVYTWPASSNSSVRIWGKYKQPSSQPCHHAEGLHHELILKKAVVTIASPAAQAFLSRLLLMLGSFVIMCLLLF